MNLYLRLLWALLRAWRQPAIQPGETISRRLTVLPNDIDVNGHMNNGRYLTLVDLLLIEYFGRVGFIKHLLRQGWRPMAGGSFISYRRGLKPLQRYELRFCIEGSDANWNFMRFEFVDREGRLCAAGYVKGAVVGRQGLVPNAQSWPLMGLQCVQHMPVPVAHWLAGESALMASTRLG
jgi:acyl-CoA thioesterase FadM